MKLENELQKLKTHIGKPGNAFDKQLKIIVDNFKSEEDKEKLHQFMKSEANRIAKATDKLISEVTLKMQLAEVSEIVSISYIAKKYFNKTRQWLYARLNGNLVNGIPATLTPEDVNILNYALKDIGKKISSTKISL